MKSSIWLLAALFVISACKKYKDPDPITDSRLTTKYCNDPAAINYNWDFPGVPDNSVCIYPAQIFKGNYMYHDSIVNGEGSVLKTDSFPMTVVQLDSTHLTLKGFCLGTDHSAKANRFFKFVIDSLVGYGQTFCNNKDTISGGGSKSGIGDTNTIQFNYILQTDTGAVQHKGTANKL
jgi:hypothetical protein